MYFLFRDLEEEKLTVTHIVFATIVLIINKNWIHPIGTSDVLKGWTFIQNYFNGIILNASGHCTVANQKCFVLLTFRGRKNKTINCQFSQYPNKPNVDSLHQQHENISTFEAFVWSDLPLCPILGKWVEVGLEQNMVLSYS